MRKMFSLLLVFASAAAIFVSQHVSAVTPTAEAAFGISPPFLDAQHLVKGSHYNQTIYLVQDQPDQDLAIEAQFEVNERVRKWFIINGGEKIVIPKGVRQFPVSIDIKVPENADLGIYRGTLRFVGAPARTGQVTVALGVELSLDFTVGEGIYEEFSVPLVRLLDIEEGWSPRVYVKFKNSGNVPEAFDRAVYELFDKFGAVRLAFIQKEKDFPEIPPFTTQEFTVEFPIDLHLGIGSYWGNVIFFQNGKPVATQRTVFNVLKEGSISGTSARIAAALKNNWQTYSALAVIVIVGAALVRRRLMKRSRKNSE